MKNNGTPIEDFIGWGDVIKELTELVQKGHEGSKELLSFIKIIDTRLSALERAVQHIEENYTSVKASKLLIDLADNLQKQVDTLAKDLYEKDN